MSAWALFLVWYLGFKVFCKENVMMLVSSDNTQGFLISAAFLIKPSHVCSGLYETAQEALETLTAWSPETICTAMVPA